MTRARLESPLELVIVPPATYASVRLALPLLIWSIEELFTLKARIDARIAGYRAAEAEANKLRAKYEEETRGLLSAAKDQGSRYRPSTASLEPADADDRSD